MIDFREYYDLLVEHISLSPAAFVLKFASRKDLPVQDLARQLNGLQKAQHKLPTWFEDPHIVYPAKLNLEQSSSEITAKHKARLFKGQKSADLTGGFGVDSFFLAQRFSQHTYVELDAELAETASHNFQSLSQPIQVVSGDGLDWLKTQSDDFDLVFLDPSRRTSKGKVIGLDDYEPNILDHLELLLQKAENVLVKASPMLDIHLAVEQLEHVAEVHIVSVKNDCKELLFWMKKGSTQKSVIKTFNYLTEDAVERFDFDVESEQVARCIIAGVGLYIYEPNVAILKAGAFGKIGVDFGLSKLHVNTHLYTNDGLVDGFPGRIFKVVDDTYTHANVLTRNHPMTEKQLRKKYKLKSGDQRSFMLAFTDVEKPKVVFAERVK